MKIPLAEQMRPKSLSDVVGQPNIIGDGKILTEIIKKGEPVNLIFWGPPGTGKTTLARIIANQLEADFTEISAVSAGKKDIEEVIARARVNWGLKLRTLVFVDEIHRFNKAQQDAFLPHVESGLITLIGATTENPSFEVISPLLSRSRVVILNKLTDENIKTLLNRALAEKFPKITVEPDALDYLAHLASGDARFALDTLELALSLGKDKIALETMIEASGRKLPSYDKNGEQHYNIISAFIKSMRASDANAALYYLARMLQAGEDPKFIARRMVIFASEDIGLAGNGALNLATSAFLSIERVGMPEGGIILSHVATVLALSKKSRATYDAWNKAKAAAKISPNSPPPLSICNASTSLMADLGYAKDYKWEAGFKLNSSYFPDDLGEQDFFKKS